jgi:hypothetical protein
LVDRIDKKNLDLNKLSIQSKSIGININMILTDGIKTIKAYTVIAEGCVQRPHYRYLVK